MDKQKLNKFYNKYYKLILVLPLIIIAFSLIHLFLFYNTHGYFFNKDISLTGGTSVTLYQSISIIEFEDYLRDKLEDVNIRKVYDIVTREEKAIIIDTKSSSDETTGAIEEYLGYELNSENSSIEFTGSTLGENFYNQLLKAIILVFLLMALVVFLLFGDSLKIKAFSCILSSLAIKLTFPEISFITAISILLFAFSIVFALIYSKSKKDYSLIAISFVFGIFVFSFPIYFLIIPLFLILLTIYFINSIPSVAVILAAFSNIIMTLTVINLFEMRLSTAGIVAILMIIGYSVDTDILLTTRVIKRKSGTINQRLFGAFKTGIIMISTSIVAIFSSLMIVRSFSNVLNQIFTILLIGLCFDIFNTWTANASIIKWYAEKRK